MGNCLIKKHGFTKTKFGNISVIKKVEASGGNSLSYTATSDCLAIFLSDTRASGSLSTTGEVLYNGAVPSGYSGLCWIVRMKTGNSGSFTGNGQYKVCGIIDIPDLSIEILGVGFSGNSGSSSPNPRQVSWSIPSPCKAGELYIAAGGYSWTSTGGNSLALTQTNCFTSTIRNSNNWWGLNGIWTVVPNDSSSTATIRASSTLGNADYGASNAAAYLFKVYKKS